MGISPAHPRDVAVETRGWSEVLVMNVTMLGWVGFLSHMGWHHCRIGWQAPDQNIGSWDLFGISFRKSTHTGDDSLYRLVFSNANRYHMNFRKLTLVRPGHVMANGWLWKNDAPLDWWKWSTALKTPATDHLYWFYSDQFNQFNIF
jgi:hypothetical protein